MQQENQLIINGKKAWEEYGIMMTDGFLSSLFAPASMKEYIEGESRLEHGKTILVDNSRVDSRDVTLSFNIHGDTQEAFLGHLQGFYALLYEGAVSLSVLYSSGEQSETFHLIYKKAVSFSLNRRRDCCVVAVKFEEPNPMNRT